MVKDLKVQLGSAVVVAQADPGEKRWGFWQFPSIGRHPDGTLVVRFDCAEDKVQRSRPMGLRVSGDGGETWHPSDDQSLGQWPRAIPLPDGGSMRVNRAVRFHPHSALPDPLAQDQHYRYWRETDVPDVLWPLQLWRWQPAEQRWRCSDCLFHIPDLALLGPVDPGTDVAAGFFPEGNLLFTRSGRLLACGYGTLVGRNGTPDPSYSAAVLESTDGGVNWSLRKLLRWDEVPGLGPNECYLCEAADASLVWVMRSHGVTKSGPSLGPLLCLRSTDGGDSWSAPMDIDSFGVLPQLLNLDNGVMVISYGRPGVHLRFSTDQGETWKHHSVVLPGPTKTGAGSGQAAPNSCSYTGLLALGDSSFMIVYSRFDHPNDAGEPAKTILARVVRVLR